MCLTVNSLQLPRAPSLRRPSSSSPARQWSLIPLPLVEGHLSPMETFGLDPAVLSGGGSCPHSYGSTVDCQRSSVDRNWVRGCLFPTPPPSSSRLDSVICRTGRSRLENPAQQWCNLMAKTDVLIFSIALTCSIYSQRFKLWRAKASRGSTTTSTDGTTDRLVAPSSISTNARQHISHVPHVSSHSQHTDLCRV